jgi:hypothetical protein
MTKKSIPTSDEAWDGRTLGADENFVTIAGKDLSAAIDEAAGTQLISIRMQKLMIDEFKAIAARNGTIGYQTLMKQILQRFIDGERKLLWNEFVSQKLKEERQAVDQGSTTRSKPRPRKAA